MHAYGETHQALPEANFQEMLPHRLLLPRLSAPERAHAPGMGEHRAGRGTDRGRHTEVRAARREPARGQRHRFQQGVRVHSVGDRQTHRGELAVRREQGEEPIHEHTGM